MKRFLLSVSFLLVFLASSASGAPNLVDIAETATADQVRQAVQAGADANALDSVGRSVLMLAAAYNPDPAVITALVKSGAKVNFRGSGGWTALMMAAYANPNPAVVDALLAAGASGKLKSAAGYTAFSYAQENEKLKGTAAYTKLRAAQ